MARPTTGTYNNGSIGVLSKSYNSNTPHWGKNIKRGRPRDISQAVIKTYLNSAVAVKQVSTITIGTAAAGNYSATFAQGINGSPITITIEAIAADTAAVIQAKLLTALKAQSALAGISFAAAAGTTITCISKREGTGEGFDGSVSGGGAGFAIVESTAPSDPAEIGFGRVVIAHPDDQDPINDSRPESAAFVGKARYPASAADLAFIVGITLESEEHGTNFFGSPFDGGSVLPFRAFNVLSTGEIGFEPASSIASGNTLHVYISGPKQGLIRGTADGVLTAPVPSGNFTQLKVENNVPAGQTGYILVK
jgi:hypothetical protein